MWSQIVNKCNVNPMCITIAQMGQKILFVLRLAHLCSWKVHQFPSLFQNVMPSNFPYRVTGQGIGRMVTQDTLGTNKNAIKQWSSNCLFYPLKETIPFVPVSHLFWGVWGLLQVELSPVGFGFAVNKREIHW